MKNSKLTYEEAIKELEEIIEELEEENLSIKDSLEKFKRGIALYNYCNDMLKDIEGEIKILLKDENDNLEEEDFYMEV
ncbi:exodeoxyribonuclease VII small subunit [Clostridium sp. Cult2]|uniref:exodeoxyribonuclease VII small subunit n=1 Tax=Clostridium sp. Cult2 TaxID=2079003 RepID=UPI001F02BBC7|nr:exodeoxyribonuclease VII small subunit [Clostridium sp. Cult2]MCF6465609.1 exodeoxyribonuclease VII small subunit [Clostridium sp. Cult2]